MGYQGVLLGQWESGWVRDWTHAVLAPKALGGDIEGPPRQGTHAEVMAR